MNEEIIPAIAKSIDSIRNVYVTLIFLYINHRSEFFNGKKWKMSIIQTYAIDLREQKDVNSKNWSTSKFYHAYENFALFVEERA